MRFIETESNCNGIAGFQPKFKTMKGNVIISLLFTITLNIQAQDYIYKIDGTEIKAKVIELTTDKLKYKSYGDEFSTIEYINIFDIYMIIYENGKRVTFKSKESNPSNNAEYNESLKNESTARLSYEFFIGGKGGMFIPTDNKAMKEIYGNFYLWGLYSGLWIGNLGLSVNFKSISKEGEPYTIGDVESASSSMSINQITISGLIKFSENKVITTYGGIGIGYAKINEKIEMTTLNNNYSDEIGIETFEVHAMVGIKIKPFFIEISTSSLPYKNNINFGGITLCGGLIF